MKPAFGTTTKVLAGAFALAGAGAVFAAMGNGEAGDRLILALLAVTFLAIGVALWAERPWAWWAGLSVTLLTVVLSVALDAPSRGGFVWPVLLVLWGASALGSWRARSDI